MTNKIIQKSNETKSGAMKRLLSARQYWLHGCITMGAFYCV